MASSAPSASSVPDDHASWLGAFAPYPGARHLCTEHISGGKMHIEWSSYATADAPAEVVAFYKKRAQSYHQDPGPGDPTFAVDGDRKLSVSKVSGDYPKCAEGPTGSEKTVIVVSQAIH